MRDNPQSKSTALLAGLLVTVVVCIGLATVVGGGLLYLRFERGRAKQAEVDAIVREALSDPEIKSQIVEIHQLLEKQLQSPAGNLGK